MRYPLALVLGAASLALPAAALDQITNEERVVVPYVVEEMGPSGVQAVELWVTTDQGETWQRAGTFKVDRAKAEWGAITCSSRKRVRAVMTSSVRPIARWLASPHAERSAKGRTAMLGRSLLAAFDVGDGAGLDALAGESSATVFAGACSRS